MKRNFIFVLVLLATLSMVNAIPHQLYERDPKIPVCDENLSPDQLNVTISPDPIVPGQPATLTISGQLTEGVPSGSTDSIAFYDATGDPIGTPFIGDICSKQGIKCPIPPGTEFTIVEKIVAPPELSILYNIAVTIVNPEHVTIACAIISSPTPPIPKSFFS